MSEPPALPAAAVEVPQKRQEERSSLPAEAEQVA